MLTFKIPSIRYRSIFLAISLGLVIGAHLALSELHSSYSGPLLFLDHLFAILFVLYLVALSAGIGHAILSRCRIVLLNPIEMSVFHIATGVGVLGTAIFLFGAVLGLKTPMFILLLIAATILVRNEMMQLPTVFTGIVAYLKQCDIKPIVLWGFLFIWAVIGVFLVTQSLLPPTDWDSQMYHLRIPAQFLEFGKIYLPEDNLHVGRVGLIHMMYLPMLSMGVESGPALLNTVFALMLGMAVFSFAVRFFDDRTAALSSCLLWGTTPILFVAISARMDVAMALYIFLTHYAALIALSNGSRMGFFYLSAILLGFAVGTKYLALVYLPALIPLLWLVTRARSASVKEQVVQLLMWGLLCTMVSSPWLIKNVILLGSPFYPYFTERILQPWHASLYGTSTIPLGVNPEVFHAENYPRQPFNLRDLFLNAGRLTLESQGKYQNANPIFFFLPLMFLIKRNRLLLWLVLPPIGYLIAMLSVLSHVSPRYLIPMAAPLTIVAAHFIIMLYRKMRMSASVRHLVLVLIVGIALTQTFQVVGRGFMEPQFLQHLVGMVSRDQFLHGINLEGNARIPASFEAINEFVPEDGKVLMIIESRGYHMQRKVIQDNTLINWPLLAPKVSDGGCLESSDITHVLVNNDVMTYFKSRGLNPSLLQWEQWESFTDRCLMVVKKERPYTLYAIKSNP